MCIFIYLFLDWFPLEFVFVYSIPLMYKYLQEFTKRRSKVPEKNMSCEHVLNCNQWNIFSENYKPIRVWFWFVYKFIKNNCRLRLFSEFIQTHKRYPTSLDKKSILTWKLLVISSQNFSYELNSKRTYSLQNISYMLLRL